MEAAWPFKTMVSYHITTWCRNSEDHDMNLHCHEDKSQTSSCLVWWWWWWWWWWWDS